MGCGKSKPQAAKPPVVQENVVTPKIEDKLPIREETPPPVVPAADPVKPPLKLPSEVMKNGTACGHVMVDNVKTPVSYHLTSDATTPGAKMPVVPLVVIN